MFHKQNDGTWVWIYDYNQTDSPELTIESEQCDSIIRHSFDVFVLTKALFILVVSINGINIWRKSKFMRW